jgi:FAD:protein FMN transferase
MPAEERFAVMGTTAHVVVVAEDPCPLLAPVQRRLAELEARWSRFRPVSEVSRLNAASGRSVVVSADTISLMVHSVDA